MVQETSSRFAAAALLAAAARFLIVRPKGGRVATMALVFAGIAAIGETRSQLYAIFVVLFLLTSVWALGTNENPRRTNKSPRRIAASRPVSARSYGSASPARRANQG